MAIHIPRPDEELDSCFFNVDPHFDCRMQIEGRKNVVADSAAVFTGNVIHSLDLHGFALSTEAQLAMRHIAYSGQSGTSYLSTERCYRWSRH